MPELAVEPLDELEPGLAGRRVLLDAPDRRNALDPGLLGLTFVGLLGISAVLYLVTVGRLRRFAQSA